MIGNLKQPEGFKFLNISMKYLLFLILIFLLTGCLSDQIYPNKEDATKEDTAIEATTNNIMVEEKIKVDELNDRNIFEQDNQQAIETEQVLETTLNEPIIQQTIQAPIVQPLSELSLVDPEVKIEICKNQAKIEERKFITDVATEMNKKIPEGTDALQRLQWMNDSLELAEALAKGEQVYENAYIKCLNQ